MDRNRYLNKSGISVKYAQDELLLEKEFSVNSSMNLFLDKVKLPAYL